MHEMEDIIDGVIVGKPDEKWGEVPVAVVIKKKGVDLLEDDFLSRFQGHLGQTDSLAGLEI